MKVRNIILKSVSIFLATSLLFTVISQKLSFNVVKAVPASVAAESDLPGSITSVPNVVTDECTENIIVYKNGDGTRTMEISMTPERYKDKDGKLKDIDNTLEPLYEDIEVVDDSSGEAIVTTETMFKEYKPKASKYNISLPEAIDEDIPILFEDKGYTIGISSMIKSKQVKLKDTQLNKLGLNASGDEECILSGDGETIYYTTGWDKNILLSYNVNAWGIKEEIIYLDNVSEEKFEFKLDVGNLIAEYDEDIGDIFIKDSSGDIQFVIPRPFMYDSSEEPRVSFNLGFSLRDIGGGKYVLTVIPDNEFLNSAETVYPVYIDPTINTYTDNVDFEMGLASNTNNPYYYNGRIDTWDSVFTTHHLGEGSVYDYSITPVPQTYTYARSYLYFQGMNSLINTGAVVTDAKLRLTVKGWPTVPTPGVDVKPVKQSDLTTDRWFFTGTFNGGFIPYTWDEYAVQKALNRNVNVPDTDFDIDITHMVQLWIDTTIENQGVCIRSTMGNGAFDHFYTAKSAYPPKLIINYIDGDDFPSAVSGATATPGSCGTSSGYGYVELTWNDLADGSNDELANGYEIRMYNGQDYEKIGEVDATATNSWSTLNKGIFPANLDNLTEQMAIDKDVFPESNGANLPTDPNPLYEKVNSPVATENEHKYSFKIFPYVTVNAGEGLGTTRYYVSESSEVWVELPETTQPNNVPAPNITLNTDVIPMVATIVWDSIEDYPAYNASGIKQYNVEMSENGETWTSASPPVLYNSEYEEYSVNVNVNDSCNYVFRVNAQDNADNLSQWSVSSEIVTPDKTAPDTGTVELNETTWTNNTHPVISWESFDDTINVAQVFYRVYLDSNTPWETAVTPGASGSQVIDTSTLEDDEYTIQLKVTDAEGNESGIAECTYYKDTIEPQIELFTTNNIAYILPIRISVNDIHLDSWEVKCNETEETICTGTSNVIDTVVNIWDIQGLTIDNTYTVTLYALDSAGNTCELASTFTVNMTNMLYDDNGSLTEFEITNPIIGTYIDENPEYILYDNMSEYDILYINGEMQNDFYIDASEFEEGELINIDVIRLNSELGVGCSGHIMQVYYEGWWATESGLPHDDIIESENIQELNNGYIYYLTLEDGEDSGYYITECELIDDNTDAFLFLFYLSESSENTDGTIEWKYSIDNGLTWENYIEDRPDIDFLEYGIKDVLIKCTLTRGTIDSPMVMSFSLYGFAFMQNDKTRIKTIPTPDEIHARNLVNYETELQWSDLGAGYTYNVYRADVSGLTEAQIEAQYMDEYTQIASSLTDTIWHDYNIEYESIYNYRVTAVRTSDSAEGMWCEAVCDVEIPDAQMLNGRYGLENEWSMASYPMGRGTAYVNLTTGSMSYTATDLVVTGPALALTMRRTYNSSIPTQSQLGPKWDFSLNTCLLKEYDSNHNETGIILKDGDGSLHRFVLEQDGSYTAPTGTFMVLIKDAQNGTYNLKRKDNIEYDFDANLRLVSLSEPNGNKINITRNTKDWIETASTNADSNGIDTETIDFTYDDWGTLLEAEDNYGRKAIYEYNEDGYLSRVTVLAGNTTLVENYFYDEAGNLTSITQPQGVYTNIGWDVSDRVDTIINAVSDELSFTYESGTVTGSVAKTSVTAIGASQSYGRTTIYELNSNGSAINVKDPLYDSNYPQYHVTEYEYNNEMLMTSISATRKAYDSVNGNVDTLMETVITWDSSGNLLTVTDPAGNVTTYSNYDTMGMPGTMQTVGGNNITAAYNYDYDYTTDNGDIIYTVTTEDPTGKITVNTYRNGLLEDIVETYKANTSYETVHTTSYNYDNVNRLTSTVLPDSSSASVSQYDSYNYPEIVTDAESNDTTYEYNALGQVTKITYEDGASERMIYDSRGNLTSHTDARGARTTYVYDKVDRVVSITDHAGNITAVSYGYTATGMPKVTYTDPEGWQTVQEMDALGMVVAETSGGMATAYEYDSMSNMIKVTDGEGRETEAYYDASGFNVKTVIVDSTNSSNNIETTATYDALGNVLSATDGEGYTIDYTYDVMGRLLTVTRHYSGNDYTDEYEYDIFDTDGNTDYFVETHENSANIVETNTYDELGRIIKEEKNGETVEHQYDNNGNEETTIYSDGTNTAQTDRVFNDMNQVTSISWAQDHWTTFEYNDNGQIIASEDVYQGTTVKTTYSYDLLGRVTQQTQDGTITSYSYKDNGALESVTYPVFISADQYTRTTEYVYNSYGQIYEVKNNGNTVASYSYNDAGQLEHETINLEFDTSGTTQQTQVYSYNELGLLISQEWLDGDINSTTQLSLQEYQYDMRGYITQDKLTKDSTTKTKNYQYDSLGRLSQDDEAGTITAYTYDSLGNRLTMSSGGVTMNYNYNSTTKRLNSVTVNSSNYRTYQYDWRGNQTEEKEYSTAGVLEETTTNTYDSQNRLLTSTVDPETGSTTSQTNIYNYAGQRIQKTEQTNGEGNFIVKYVYLGSNPLYTTDINNRTMEEHVLDPSGAIIASKRFGGDYEGNFYFYKYDVRGSTMQIVGPDINDNIVAVKDYDYDAFGNVTESGASFFNETQFTGAVTDASTGYVYMNARYYNPDNARFLTQDTYTGNAYQPWTQNLYTYTGNNPVNFVDPTGHFATIIGAFAGGIAGAITAWAAGGDVTAGFIGGAASGAIVGAAIDLIAISGGTAALAIGGAVLAAGGISSVASIGFVATAGYAGGVVSDYVNQCAPKVMNGSSLHESIMSVNMTQASITGGVNALFAGYSVYNFGISSSFGGTSNAKMIQSLKNSGLINEEEMMKMITQDGIIDTVAPLVPTTMDATTANITSTIVNDIVPSPSTNPTPTKTTTQTRTQTKTQVTTRRATRKSTSVSYRRAGGARGTTRMMMKY